MRFHLSVLRDFRNFRSLKVQWEGGVNLILGPNGSGKTNLLESLSILAGWGPFASRIGKTLSWDSQEGRAVLGAQVAGEEGHEIQVLLSSRMTPKVDGKRVLCTDLRVILPSIVFLPTDINLIDGSPSARRLFVDKLCALYHPPYARRLAEFHQISRHRAALLRQGKPVRGTTLPFARLGGWVMEARRYVVSRLSLLLREKNPVHLTHSNHLPHSSHSDQSIQSLHSDLLLDLAMTPRLDSDEGRLKDGAGAGGSETYGEAYLLRALEETAEREAHALRPLVGPSRDDLELTVQGRPAADSLSRGQKRRLVISLILTAGRLIEMRLKRRPVLFFDDLAAELDAEGRRTAGEALVSTGWQILVTGTENPFPDLEERTHIVSLPASPTDGAPSISLAGR